MLTPDLRRRPLTDQTKFNPSDLLRPMIKPLVDAAKVVRGENVAIIYDTPHAEMATMVSEEIHRKNARHTFCRRDLDQNVARALEMPLERISELHKPEHDITRKADRIILLRGARDPEILSQLDQEKRRAYNNAYSEAIKPRAAGQVPWLLTCPPTEHGAKLEGITLKEFVEIYSKACNQPWGHIKEAQQILVERLNAASTLRLRANHNDPAEHFRTDLMMSIKGMTFVNSTISRNYPGSEVFSAPIRDSVNGQLYAPGLYMYDGIKMRDLHFTVRNGRIKHAEAREGNLGLQEILSQGEGARYFGEVALGTNPGLTKRLIDDSLAEKISGTFHITPGHAYTYTEYDGVPVKVNNGNTSDLTPIHWDIVVPMHPGNGGGQVLIEGELWQEDGKFLDPRLSILNPVG
jgi:aminopeptidase